MGRKSRLQHRMITALELLQLPMKAELQDPDFSRTPYLPNSRLSSTPDDSKVVVFRISGFSDIVKSGNPCQILGNPREQDYRIMRKPDCCGVQKRIHCASEL